MGLFNWLLGLPVKEVTEGITKYKELDQAPLMAQNKTNEEEAKSDSLFKSGWRPFIGWGLGVCFWIYSVPIVAIATFVWTDNWINTGIIGPYPVDLSVIWHIMITMLGMSGLRTLDKIFGKNS